MPGRLMSDAEIRHRKKVQGHVSQATGALGLAALGGTLAASRGGRNTLRKIPQLKNKIKAPPPKDPNRDRIKGAVTPVLATSAGLGGASSFNFAAYTNAESRKRKAAVAPVKKDVGMDMGYFGEEGHQVELPEITVSIEKAWEPVARNYDPEAKRKKRSEAYPKAAAGASGGLAAGAAYKTGEALSQRGQSVLYRPRNAPYGPLKRGQAAHVKGVSRALNVKAGKSLKGAGALAGAAAATAGASHVLNRKKDSKSWESYGKRDTVSKLGEWKTIEQRERTQRGSRKRMRQATAGAVAGGGLALVGHKQGGTPHVKQAGQTIKAVAQHPEFSHKDTARATGRILRETAGKKGAGAIIGGAALAGGAMAVGAGAKGHHTYQQRKINQRRRANFKKSAFGVDHIEAEWTAP